MALTETLTVGDEAELGRFWSKVVKGPTGADCWLWVGAIADDGYGRFWVVRNGVNRVVRPHRYVLAWHSGPLTSAAVAMHRCDVPTCCRPDTRHVVGATQAENLADMGRKGRGSGGAWLRRRHAGTDRAEVAARSRALRAAVRSGWNPDAVAVALRGHHESLF